jgi:hypothetical protein
MRVYELAARYRVPVAIHYNFDYGTKAESGAAEVERAVAGNPRTVFILSHHINVGLMKKYPNLWGEYFYHPSNPHLSTLLPGNEALFDRVVVGTDIQEPGLGRRSLPWWTAGLVPGHKEIVLRYPDILDGLRRELGRLPPDVAEKVAFRNLERLLSDRLAEPERAR